MSSYKNMNVALDDEDEEPLDVELDEEETDEEDEELEDDEDDTEDSDGESEASTEANQNSKSSEESQLAGMITVVWILAIIGIIITVASSIIKHRQESKIHIEYVNVASGMYALTDLATETNVWSDSLSVERKIQTNGNTVSFYLTGMADSYGKIVYIPVTRNDFNSVNDGESIAFTYSRLNIDGKEHIIVHQWNKK